jgi:hypothetical protein
MSSTYLAASADSASDLKEQVDSERSPSAKSSHSPEQCFGSIGLTCPASRMCVTCAPSTSGQLTLFAEDSLARTSASQDAALDSPGSAPGYGGSTTASSTNVVRRGSSRKTYQPFDLADWIRCSGHSLRSGMTRSGTVFPLPPLTLLTKGTASGSWPTPHANCHTGAGHKAQGGINLQTAVKRWPTPTSRDYKDGSASSCANVPPNGLLGRVVHQGSSASGSLNPTWVEWLMEFPLGFTALEPSEMPSSRKPPKSSGKPSLRPKGPSRND